MNPGRNDPCPCGSGNKYKKCCGKVAQIIPVKPVRTSSALRECGDCTACCDGWLKSTIYGHEMRPGVRCHFVRDGGCTIYETRPESPCRQFECGWVDADSPFPEEFKPTKLGVIIVKTTWRGLPAYRLAHAGRDLNEAELAWFMRFAEQTSRPFFYEQNGETTGYGPQAFVEDMQMKLRKGLPLFESHAASS
ncbi:SEC-C metal-binding domain-containing protein [uncultured Oxalicibacterium sp.]|uniref:SEC-C metal-binding domain-containing protein n=1 Tax=uncultured Oxalicibacterium sp. TaxID=1168540 RepID=UPI00260056B3|nr:SEC-C metal-binding domain-containing protein [uncultured Oxalicibacterium sp.]